MKRARIALILFVACTTPGADPLEAYQALVRSVQHGEIKTAYDGLSQPTRALLEARAHELAAASDGGVRDDPTVLLFLYLPQIRRPPAMSELSVERRDTDLAILKSPSSDGVRMVREKGLWKLDLTDKVKP